MSEVVVHNHTQKDITFILFQVNGIMDVNSYSSVFYRHTAEKNGGIGGPCVVPSAVQISVEASPSESAARGGDDDDIIMLGPLDAHEGEAWGFNGEALQLVSSDEDEEAIAVENQSEQADQHINVSVWKEDRRVFTQKEVGVGETLAVLLNKKIYIALVEGDKLPQGHQFQLLSLEESHTAFDLTHSTVDIIAKEGVEGGDQILFSTK